MTDLNQLVNQAVNQIQSGQPVTRSESVNIDNWAASQVDKLFASLCAQHPAWRSFLKSEQEIGEYKRQLVLAMMENGINRPEMLKLGIQKSRRNAKPWMPGVGEFVSWCKPTPEDYGLPSTEEAFQEVNNHIWNNRMNSRNPHIWSHPAVYWSAIQTPSHDRGHMTYDQWRKVFEHSYSVATRKVMNGEDLSGCLPKALPTPDTDTRTDEEIQAAIADGRKKLRELLEKM